MNVPTLCLNMIVKNESKIILRFLTSVYTLLDSYCICDTGSTDNTIDLIITFFQEKKIPGKIVKEPFRDFGYNRTFALKCCEDCIHSDYLLLLDADMILEINQDSNAIHQFKKNLIHDAYLINQGTVKFHYKNIRIIKNRQGYIYWGVTHEYVKLSENCNIHTLDKEDIFILDIGDGGCKEDKIIRDIRLLSNGLKDVPNNDRYTFYLANSYRDKGDYEIAIKYYKKRMELRGWIEEIWFSCYMIGNCYKRIGKMEKAIYYWLEAYNIYPCRIENLYKIIKYYRICGKHYLANIFYRIADEERKKTDKWSYLFTELDVYTCKLDYEMSIIGYYSNIDKIDLIKSSMKVLCSNECVDDVIIQNVFANYKFYSKKIIYDVNIFPFLEENQKTLQDIGKNIIESNSFFSSTPTFCFGKNKKELLVCVRYVNYYIDDKGQYINKEQIITQNVIAIIDISSTVWIKKHESILKYDNSYDDYYVGQEDIRFHRIEKKQNKKTKIDYTYNANRCFLKGTMNVEHGNININATVLPFCTNSFLVKKVINHENEYRTIEKNWVLFNDKNGNETCIYEWYPLTIGKIKKDTHEYIESNKFNTPTFFKHVRGSSNGIIIKDEIWFLCHVVSYEDRRYYYHLIVVLDKNTLQLKSWTNLWTFEGISVEYTLGMILLNDMLLIGYSLMDRQTKYIMLPPLTFQEMMMT